MASLLPSPMKRTAINSKCWKPTITDIKDAFMKDVTVNIQAINLIDKIRNDSIIFSSIVISYSGILYLLPL